MREFLESVWAALPVSLVPYIILGGGVLLTAFCFALAYLLNRK